METYQVVTNTTCIPPYLKVAATALSAEIFGVSHLSPSLLEAREAVQLYSQLTRGPQSGTKRVQL